MGDTVGGSYRPFCILNATPSAGACAMICCIEIPKISRIVCCIAVLVLSITVSAQQAGHILNNDDIIKMTHDGFDEAVIVALVESNPTDFDVSIDGLNALKSSNVSGKVMEAMLKAE